MTSAAGGRGPSSSSIPEPGDSSPATGRRTAATLGGSFRGRALGQTLGLLFVLLVTILQLRLLTATFIVPRAIRGWEARAYSAWERSALLSEGADFLEFVVFLRHVIPETGKVVFPPHSYVGRAGSFTELGFMQYFMFPRSVLNCSEPVEECVRSLTGSSSYVVAVGGFPPASAAAEVKDYVPFREDKGVYVPR